MPSKKTQKTTNLLPPTQKKTNTKPKNPTKQAISKLPQKKSSVIPLLSVELFPTDTSLRDTESCILLL